MWREVRICNPYHHMIPFFLARMASSYTYQGEFLAGNRELTVEFTVFAGVRTDHDSHYG